MSSPKFPEADVVVAQIRHADVKDPGVAEAGVIAAQVCQPKVQSHRAHTVAHETGGKGRRHEVQRARVVETRDGVTHVSHTRPQRTDIEITRNP